jgi:hypothetical protein
MSRFLSPISAPLAVLIALSSPGATGAKSTDEQRPSPMSVTCPFVLDHNRIIVEVKLVGADGRSHTANAWVDTGAESLIISESAARKIGLDTSALETSDGHGSVESNEAAPEVLLGSFPLSTDGAPLRIFPGNHTNSGIDAEVHLSASALRGLHVIFDYPERKLTVARPGSLEPRGSAMPCKVDPDTGLFLTSVKIDGEIVKLGVDTGSAGTWISRELVSEWSRNHPDRPTATGAVGSTNFFGFDFEVSGILMSLPGLEIGSLRVADVAALGLGQGLFDWYSRKSAEPVAGFIGGNVLRQLRLEVNWPEQTCYWAPGASSGHRDLDIVGLTLRPDRDGRYTVAAVVKQNGIPTVKNVQAGDQLLEIDGFKVFGATMGTVVDALRGTPGDMHHLLLDRNGARLTAEVLVRRFP